MIFIFSQLRIREGAHRAFELVHFLTYVVYILTVLHGSLGLIQRPEFYWYILGPAILYVLDKIISLSRRGQTIKAQATLVQPFRDDAAQLQGVVQLVWTPPPGFRFTAGQSIQIACQEIGDEFHPFSISSAPHESEEKVSVHVRVVGKWTRKLALLVEEKALSKEIHVHVDGPYGDHAQHWSHYKVAIMICGGIGVTPFCSILNEMTRRIKSGGELPFLKMYFVWVEKTHENWDWMLQAIRQLESENHAKCLAKAFKKGLKGKDFADYVQTQSKFETILCLTAVSRKVDLRLAMVRAFDHTLQQTDEETNVLGIRGNTLYGRPDLASIIRTILGKEARQGSKRSKLSEERIDTIGVFSVGGTVFVNAVSAAISQCNSEPGPIKVVHHHN